MEKPLWLIGIGFVLEVAAIAVIVLILMGVLTSTFFLNFTAFGISVLGLFMGLIGSASLVKLRRGARKNSGDGPPEG